MSPILDRITRELGLDVVALLSERLSPSDLSSVLLELAKRRASARSPSELLAQYATDRFVRPSRCDPRVLGRVTLQALDVAAAAGFTPVSLAPLTPLGTSSVVATASQNKVVSTSRHTEAVSDATNVLALECATRRLKAPTGPSVSLCASQRMTRAQAFKEPGYTAHFELFVTVTAGRDPGGRRFEADAANRAIAVQLRLLDTLSLKGFAPIRASVRLSPDVRHEPVARDVAARLRAEWPALEVVIDGARIAASGYYRGLCFGVWVTPEGGEPFPLGDGGLTDWTAKLTGSRKERFFVGALGTELLAAKFSPSL